jgi:hypothetical protein
MAHTSSCLENSGSTPAHIDICIMRFSDTAAARLERLTLRSLKTSTTLTATMKIAKPVPINVVFTVVLLSTGSRDAGTLRRFA